MNPNAITKIKREMAVGISRRLYHMLFNCSYAMVFSYSNLNSGVIITRGSLIFEILMPGYCHYYY